MNSESFAPYTEKPEIVSVSKSGNIFYTSVNFDITEVDGGYECETVTMKTETPLSANDYGEIVSKIIRNRYSSDDVEAILCNYNSETPTASAKREMQIFQDWRETSKRTATEALEYLEKIKDGSISAEASKNSASAEPESSSDVTDNSETNATQVKKSLWQKIFSR